MAGSVDNRPVPDQDEPVSDQDEHVPDQDEPVPGQERPAPDKDELPPVAILCGGRGTRLQRGAAATPKPLVEIGGRPVLWHVIQIYLHQGFRRFLLLTGYRGDAIAAFTATCDWPRGASITCVETGIDTPTGGRVHRALASGALGTGDFCLAYADGVADLDLRRLVSLHRARGRTATLTLVRPRLPFGIAQVGADGRVHGFVEKPRSEQWVNGGFLCLEAAVARLLNDQVMLEREPLAGLARDGQLQSFKHHGFWQCLDTYKDALLLNDLWDSDQAPWKLWE